MTGKYICPNRGNMSYLLGRAAGLERIVRILFDPRTRGGHDANVVKIENLLCDTSVSDIENKEYKNGVQDIFNEFKTSLKGDRNV